jgi:hypothetical protein
MAQELSEVSPQPHGPKELNAPDFLGELLGASKNALAAEHDGKKTDIDLASLNNSDYVRQVKIDTHLSPVAEWSTFGVAVATKGAAKAFVLSKIGNDIGVAGKLGVPAGIAAGVVGAGFFTYELANYWENSSRAQLFEKRLSEDKDARGTAGGGVLDLKAPNYDNQLPGFRDLVNLTVSPLIGAYKHVSGSQLHDRDQLALSKTLAQKSLTNEEFISWAKKETSVPLSHHLKQDGLFGGVGLAASVYTATKLGLGRLGTPALAVAGLGAALALSHIKTAEEVNQGLSELYAARLLTQDKVNRQ